MDEEFRVRYRLTVQFRDLDMLAHVNNATYLSYLEEARLHYYKTLARDLPTAGGSFILASATIHYRSPAFLGEELEVGLGVRELKTTSFVFRFGIREVKSGRLVADGRLVQVCYDYAKGVKEKLPSALREAVCAFEGLADCGPG